MKFKKFVLLPVAINLIKNKIRQINGNIDSSVLLQQFQNHSKNNFKRQKFSSNEIRKTITVLFCSQDTEGKSNEVDCNIIWLRFLLFPQGSRRWVGVGGRLPVFIYLFWIYAFGIDTNLISPVSLLPAPMPSKPIDLAYPSSIEVDWFLIDFFIEEFSVNSEMLLKAEDRDIFFEIKKQESKTADKEASLKRISRINGVLLLFGLVILFSLFSLKDSRVIAFREYIGLLRVPIISGLILIFTPIFLQKSNIFQNLFVMVSRGQIFGVSLIISVTSLMITSSFQFILENSGDFVSESTATGEISLVDIFIRIAEWLNHLLLSIPVISLSFFRSNPEILLSLPIFFVTTRLSMDNLKLTKNDKFLLLIFSLIILLIIPSLAETYVNTLIKEDVGEKRIGYDFEFFFLVFFSFILYIFVFWQLNPKKLKSRKKDSKKFLEASALFYLLLLICLLTGVFSLLTFVDDKWCNAPLSLFVILFSGSTYFLFYTDYYFKLNYLPKATIDRLKLDSDEVDDFKDIINERLKVQNLRMEEKTLVIISTSGGGIQASGWTAQVLCGLQKELGTSFTQSIGLISSVSGGSVGTMFFLDLFDTGGGIDTPYLLQYQYQSQHELNNSLETIFNNSTTDWLDAVGWGLVCPDMVRGFFGLAPGDKYNDRGYSLESDWKRSLKNPEAKLSDWRYKVRSGTIPIPIFNATLVENGRRFLISPVKLVGKQIKDVIEYEKLINKDVQNNPNIEDAKELDFYSLFPKLDLNVTTAARLSATFPYVSPIARNENKENIAHNYHVADGGFFDNAGLFTAVEWLDKHLETLDDVKRVLLIQINSIPPEKIKERENGDLGWWTQLIGPLKTLYSIRDSTQIARNQRLKELINRSLTREKVDFQSFDINFPDKQEYKPPLSWRLTSKQIEVLKKSWDDLVDSENFNQLRILWHQKWNIPQDFYSHDYTKLEELLKNHKWQEADNKTLEILCKAAGIEMNGYLNEANIDDISDKDLKIIDSLWLEHSDQRFGFTPQKRVMLQAKNNFSTETKGNSTKQWRQFYINVGWKERSTGVNNLSGYRTNSDLAAYNLKNPKSYQDDCPEGHLPAALFLSERSESKQRGAHPMLEKIYNRFPDPPAA